MSQNLSSLDQFIEFVDAPDGSLAAEPRRILFVDDEVNIVNSLKRCFRNSGYILYTAHSGQQALDVLSRENIGVILSDQRMPEMTGVELLSRVKEKYPDTIRIVLSGYTELNSITDAINEGAVYKFLTKPWEDEQLRKRVEEAFADYEIRREKEMLSRQLASANYELSLLNVELKHHAQTKEIEATRSIQVLEASQSIIDALPVGVLGIDSSGVVVMCNRILIELFGADGAGLLGTSFDAIPGLLGIMLEKSRQHKSARKLYRHQEKLFCIHKADFIGAVEHRGEIFVIEQLN